MPRVVTWGLAAGSVLAGAAMTVAVAWGCMVWSRTTRSSWSVARPELAAPRAGPDGEVGLWDERGGPGWAELSLSGMRRRDDPVWTRWWEQPVHRVAGWPMKALWSRVDVQVMPRPPEVAAAAPGGPRRRWALTADEIWHRGLNTSDLPRWLRPKVDRRVPLVPLWGGFAADTAVYGAGVFGVVAWRRAARLRRRRARGLCVGCGYDLRGHAAGAGGAICPECGLGGAGL